VGFGINPQGRFGIFFFDRRRAGILAFGLENKKKFLSRKSKMYRWVFLILIELVESENKLPSPEFHQESVAETSEH
jgi:hypothetical protein